MDHDALFKWLLKDPVILRSFFEEFLPEVASYTDFSRLEYLDKETRTLRGQRRTGDLLVKVRFKGQEAAFLIHVEHEARRDRDIAWRLLEYVVLDRRESGLPVYPVFVLAGSAGPASERPVHIELFVEFATTLGTSPVPEARRRSIQNLSLPKIEALGEALLDFHSPQDLARWLQKNAPPAAIRKIVKAPKVTRKP
jgi:hypothetical protein